MRQVNRSVLLPYSAEQMFDIVNNVADYPVFLPWCEKARVISEDEQSMIAELTIARSGLEQSFITKNLLYRPERIELNLVEGPFRMLSGTWQFYPLGGDGCRVEVRLSFEIDSRLAGSVLSNVLDRAINSFVDAFCDRADHVYGN